MTEEQLENKLENVPEKVKESVLREKPKFTIPEKLSEPLNNVEYDLSEAEKRLLSKGPSFCPMPFYVNWPKATEAFADWENQVRRKWFFHKLKNKEGKEEIEENSWYEEDDKEDKHCKRMPWYDKSDWVAPSATKEIEDFIENVRLDLFENQNKKTWVSDNLEKEERVALKNFRKWNREGSEKIIRIQDKNARLVIDSKERIIQETERTLNDGKTFGKEEDNQQKII